MESSPVLKESDGETFVCTISDLPNEVLTHIFSFINPMTIWTTVVRVCERWKKVASHPSLWHSLTFKCENVQKCARILEIISQCPALTFLKIQSSGNVTPVVQTLSRKCPKLTHLDLGFNCVSSKESIIELVDGCPLIEFLNLEGMAAKDPYETAFYPITKLENLKNLNLCHCPWVTDGFIYELALSKCSIEALNIDGIPYVTDASMVLFLTKKGSHLKYLWLDGEGLTEVTFSKLCNSVDLLELSISFSENMTCSSLQKIIALPKLKKLRVRKGMTLPAEGMIQAFATLKCFNLVSLNLSECHSMSDQVLECVLRKIPLLTYLSIDWCCYVTSKGFGYIKYYCPRLTHLSVIGLCRVAESSLDDLPERIPKLTFLDLTSCNEISDKCIQKLTEKMPSLCAVNYFGAGFVYGKSSDTFPAM